MKSAVWLSKISLLIIVLIVNCQTLNYITKDFYKSSDALLAGRTVEIAYKFGRNAIQMASIPEHLTPQLLKKSLLGEENSNTTSESLLPGDFSSQKSVDYTRLRDLLAAKQWKQADEETLAVMFKAAGREKEGWLDYTSIENFPCIYLRTIDQLWVEYSNGRFGFSVQKRIWESVGKDYEKFGNAIGWCQENKNVEWLNYDNLTFNLDARSGHLPAAIAPPFQVRGVWIIAWKRQALFSFLMSKLATCNL